MSHHTTKQGVLFENLSKKTVTVKFDQDHASSDGGAVLLKACDEKLGLSSALASCLSDDRQQSKVTHSCEELFQQRLFAIACGYADGNDAARLADDPVMKLLAGRDPIAGGRWRRSRRCRGSRTRYGHGTCCACPRHWRTP